MARRSQQRITRITASIDGGAERELRAGIPRPDVDAAFAGRSRARDAGFRGEVWLDRASSRLEVWAYSPSGMRRRAFTVTLRRTLPPPLVVAPPADPPRRWARLAGLPGWWARRRLEGPFQAALLGAAGAEFPRVAEAAPRLLEELRRAWPPFDRRWAMLRRAFTDEPRPPPPGPVRRGRRQILLVSGMFPSVLHGGGLRLFDLVQALGVDHDLDLYAPFREDLDGKSFQALRRSLRAARLVRSPELRAEDIQRWLVRSGRRPGDYDVAHFEFPESGPTIPTVRGWAGRSFFTLIECRTRSSMIDLERALTDGSGARAAVSRLASNLAVERAAVAGCHRAIAVTDTDADFAERCFGAPRPLVVPTCLSREIERGLRDDLDEPARLARVALFVGYFDHRPNVEGLRWYLERVHPLVARRVPGYRLRVVGHGDLSEVRARWAHDSRVELLGAVDSLGEQLSSARIGLGPMLSGAGIRGKINQYSAAGRPTVSTRIAAAGLPYRDGESIALAETPEEFARAVERLLTDDELWRGMGARCRAVAREHFSWPTALARLEAAYEA